MFENWQILKTEIEEKSDEYAEVAEWCNQSGAYTIIEDGEYYRVIPVEVPEPEPEVAEDEQIVKDSNL